MAEFSLRVRCCTPSNSDSNCRLFLWTTYLRLFPNPFVWGAYAVTVLPSCLAGQAPRQNVSHHCSFLLGYLIFRCISFTDEHGNDNMKQVIEDNYRQVKTDVLQIVESEMERIKNDPDLQHLIQQD